MIDLAIDSRVFITNVVDEALQELDMIFNTENTELIGYPTYGTFFEQFLWQLTPSPEEVRRYIYEHIQDTYFLSQMTVDVDVRVLRGEMRAIYHVSINVSDGNFSGSREYQFR